MTLRPLSDVSPSDWFVPQAGVGRLSANLGPAGFESYARVLHGPEDSDEHDSSGRAEGHLSDDLLAALCEALDRHTDTPQDCFFALWDGYGNIHGGEAVAFLAAPQMPAWFGRIFGTPKNNVPPPAFPPNVMDGPRLHANGLDFLLFAGALDQAGDWGAVDYAVGAPRGRMNSPNLFWPADHSWFVTTNIDGNWSGVGGSERLIAELLADRRLEAIRTTYTDNLPEYR